MKALLVAVGVLFLAAPAMAQNSGGQAPIKISQCRAEHNPGSPGGYAGYTPGYYPYGSRGYAWRDPWAHTYYQPPTSPTGTLYIDFTNSTTNEMTAIDFGLIARGYLVAEVRDVGKFSPGVEVKHKYGVSPNVFPLGTASPACAPLYIEYANGATWKNPTLPKTDAALYQGHP